MAKIRATDFNIQTGNVASVTVVMPAHQTGDLLLVFAGKDDATGTDPTTATSGWTRGGSGVSGGATTAAVRAAWFYKLAASSDEPDLVITSSDSDTWSILAISIQGVDQTTPIDANSGNGNTDSTGAPYAITGVTTATANALVFFAALSGGAGCPVPYPGLQLVGALDSGNEGVAAAYMLKAATGATGSWNFYADATNQNIIGFCVAVRDDGNGLIPAYWDTDYATLIHPFRGSSTIITSDAWGAALTNYPTTGKDAVSQCTQVDSDGGPSYVDYTTAANNATDADVVPFPAAEIVNDHVVFGYDRPFQSLVFDRAGCTQGVAGVVAWEYWDGAAWIALTSVTDATTGFTSVVGDGQVVRWAMPPRFNWTKTTINGGASLYFVRARVTTTFTTNPTISQVYVGGQATVFDGVGASTDAGVVQFENASNVTPATNTTQVGGTYIDLGQTVSLANTIVCSTYQFTLPRDYVDAARFKEGGGIHVFFADTSFNRRAWCIGSYLDALTTDAQRNRFAIDWEQAVDTSHAKTTTAPSDTIADVFIGGMFPRGAGSVAFSHMAAIAPANAVINGGSSSSPITLDEWRALGNASPLLLFRDDKPMIPFIIGGSDDVHLALDNFTIEFPGVATPWTSEIYSLTPRSSAHYAEDVLGVTINAQSGDTCKLTNGKITSDTRWKFDVLSSASASATYDFTGLLLIRALVTLRAVYTWSAVTFNNCDITQNSAVIDACDFTNGSYLTSNNPGLISDSTFTSSGTGHAIELTTAGTYSFVGNVFAGYGAGGTTDAAIYNNSGGAITLNISGGGSTPTVRNGAGASTTINNNVSVTVTPLRTGSEVRVYKVSDGSEVAGVESSSGSSFVFSVGSGVAVHIVVLCNSPPTVPRRYENRSFTTDQNFDPVQIDDLNFENP